MGIIVEYVSFRRVATHDASVVASISSLAFGLLFTDLMRHLWGADPVAVSVASAFKTTGFSIFNVNFVPLQGLIIIIAFVLMLALNWVITYTSPSAAAYAPWLTTKPTRNTSGSAFALSAWWYLDCRPR